jgi:hypothetical protein
VGFGAFGCFALGLGAFVALREMRLMEARRLCAMGERCDQVVQVRRVDVAAQKEGRETTWQPCQPTCSKIQMLVTKRSRKPKKKKTGQSAASSRPFPILAVPVPRKTPHSARARAGWSTFKKGTTIGPFSLCTLCVAGRYQSGANLLLDKPCALLGISLRSVQ